MLKMVLQLVVAGLAVGVIVVAAASVAFDLMGGPAISQAAEVAEPIRYSIPDLDIVIKFTPRGAPGVLCVVLGEQQFSGSTVAAALDCFPLEAGP